MIPPKAATKRLRKGGLALLIRPLETSSERLAAKRYKPGLVLHIMPGHNRPSCCRAEIVEARDTTLDRVTADEAQRAGFGNLQELYALWRDRYRTGPLARPAVRLLEVRGVPLAEPVLFLHRDSTKGYTTSAGLGLRGEMPAMVDRETVERYALEQRQRAKLDQARSRAQREREVLRKRLPELRARNATGVVKMMTRKLEHLDRELGDQEAA